MTGVLDVGFPFTELLRPANDGSTLWPDCLSSRASTQLPRIPHQYRPPGQALFTSFTYMYLNVVAGN